MTSTRRYRQHGQSLVEVIVAIGIVTLLSVGIIAGTTSSLRSGRFGNSKSQAIKYAQEGIEIARRLRDTGWATFQTYGTDTGKTWCLDKAGAWTAASGSCSANIDSTYTRSVVFTWNDPKMKVDVTISWSDGSGNHTSTLTTYFTQWR